MFLNNLLNYPCLPLFYLGFFAMNKKEFSYKWLKIMCGVVNDELYEILVIELEHNIRNEIVEDINEKIIEAKVFTQ